jgi:hypothetical protein
MSDERPITAAWARELADWLVTQPSLDPVLCTDIATALRQLADMKNAWDCIEGVERTCTCGCAEKGRHDGG